MRHLGQEQHVPPDTRGLASLQLADMTGSPPLAQTTSNAKSACCITSYESSSEPGPKRVERPGRACSEGLSKPSQEPRCGPQPLGGSMATRACVTKPI